ncbi:MAG: hypothetical protein IKM76_11595 [Prevotella sp.]|jgi:hypothetical protein|nr:hypothetical protein [Prevotella sp.]MBR6828772.1 hypothetical protein [Prevotella sp.]MBR6867138.1 hypothetical protein [Prevotella sp.]
MGKLEIKTERISRDFEFESGNLRLVGNYGQLSANGELTGISANIYDTQNGSTLGYVRADVRDSKLVVDITGVTPDLVVPVAGATDELCAMVTGNESENVQEGGES